MLLHREGLAIVVAPVSEDFVHVPKGVLAVKRPFRYFLVLREVARPRKARISETTDKGMKIARLTSIKVLTVVKNIPDKCANGS
jgi:hypothetical protein